MAVFLVVALTIPSFDLFVSFMLYSQIMLCYTLLNTFLARNFDINLITRHGFLHLVLDIKSFLTMQLRDC